MTEPAAPASAIRVPAQAVRSVLAAELGEVDRVQPVTSPEVSLLLGDDLVAAVISQRVLPVVAPQWEVLGLAPELGQQLIDEQRAQTLAAMATIATTARVSSALARAGVPHLMIKGPALAIQTTGDPLGRGAGDVDVLIQPAAVGAAVSALAGAGFGTTPVGTPTPGQPTFRAVLRSQKELTLIQSGIEIDLHWRLDDARACLSWTFDELLAGSEQVTIGGVAIRTLAHPHATVFNASHAGSDAWSSLRALVDQARLQRGQDLTGLRAEAYRVGAGRRWDLAQVMVARLLGTPTSPVARSIDALGDAMWRWLLAGEGPRERVNARASLRGLGASVLTLDSPQAAAQRLEAVVWPVGAMADRALGDVGDRHPWIYPLATPYFLPKRLTKRWRSASPAGV